MFNVPRYDPSSASKTATASPRVDPTHTGADEDAKLKSLREKIEERRRKRLGLAEAGSSDGERVGTAGKKRKRGDGEGDVGKGKGKEKVVRVGGSEVSVQSPTKTVRFGTAPPAHQPEDPSTLASTSNEVLPPSALKKPQTSEESSKTVASTQVKAAGIDSKTPAKKRYLKRKKERRKGRLRGLPKRADEKRKDGEGGGDVQGGEGDEGESEEEGEEDASMVSSVRASEPDAEDEEMAEEEPERLETSEAGSREDAQGKDLQGDGEEDEEARRERRRQEKKAKKEAREKMVEEEDEEAKRERRRQEKKTKKEARKRKEIERELTKRQDEGRKRSAEPKDVATIPTPQAVPPTVADVPDITQPEEVGYLTRFPRPSRPAAPDEKVLASLRMGLEEEDGQSEEEDGVDAEMGVEVEGERDGEVRVSEGGRVSVDDLRASNRRLALSGGEKEADGICLLSKRSRERLTEMECDQLFSVQSTIIPLLLSRHQTSVDSLYPIFDPPRDVCVSAPTGSGKTLSYVVPVVEILSKRIVTRLRALVILPTRDLVSQVRETFEIFSKGTGLKIATATGQHSFAHEQSSMVGELVGQDSKGGSSKVDILIATPGRLMDHLKSTKGFTLQHLRFLIIDEADRLLNQSFHAWISGVLSHLKPSPAATSASAPPTSPIETSLAITADHTAPGWGTSLPPASLDEPIHSHTQTQKLLFSATLTRDPVIVSALQLRQPLYVTVSGAVDGADKGAWEARTGDVFTLPLGLSEFMVSTTPAHKPLTLLHLLHRPRNLRAQPAPTEDQTDVPSSIDYSSPLSNLLIFTHSVESAKRLNRLVELFEDEMAADDKGGDVKRIVCKCYSSDLNQGERSKILGEFKSGKVDVLISTSLLTRGIDLPSISHVINYDLPVDLRGYVHRVGRTARAGRQGGAWSLVIGREASYFRSILAKAQRSTKMERVKIKVQPEGTGTEEDVVAGSIEKCYERALEKLGKEYGRGRQDDEDADVV